MKTSVGLVDETKDGERRVTLVPPGGALLGAGALTGVAGDEVRP